MKAGEIWKSKDNSQLIKITNIYYEELVRDYIIHFDIIKGLKGNSSYRWIFLRDFLIVR